ncbi:MAG: hypothetical protein JNN18_09660 [Rubrivivax sp.]|nr:hypothetical protein [Rubrivivax sp.]
MANICKNPTRRSFAVAIAASAAALASGTARAASLDGKTYEGVFLARGQTKGDADTLSFRNGRFRSAACDRYGYGDAAYTTTDEGGAVRFDAQTESPRYGSLRWTGYVRGDRLDATAWMLQNGKPPREHWVAAALKP